MLSVTRIPSSLLVVCTAVFGVPATGCGSPHHESGNNSPAPASNASGVPICASKADIQRLDGQTVTLIGTYSYFNAGKCMAASVDVGDASVIVDYQPDEAAAKALNGKKVKAVGRVTVGQPYTDPKDPRTHSQWLSAPHLSDMKPIEEMKS